MFIIIIKYNKIFDKIYLYIDENSTDILNGII